MIQDDYDPSIQDALQKVTTLVATNMEKDPPNGLKIVCGQKIRTLEDLNSGLAETMANELRKSQETESPNSFRKGYNAKASTSIAGEVSSHLFFAPEISSMWLDYEYVNCSKPA
jgi:hypothetical protein